ncbi:phage tail protein [Segetibacter aerophilus]|uniref:Tail Collar domain-containing protein n=1 Tax=Segetibacter aerophilus TaxID=670293 RepID=A0A512BDK3_9BACT|nr:tail fiber protein [Segetibacter aerophilus]GEO10041.1 tail Collar domain-containing protein [Segetibacter aerophilus]
MAEPFIGQITLFAGTFAPRGWAFCQGQILSIAQNTALFSILGTTYGGNGQTTFALPDLRGRVPVGPGQGPGLSNYSLGQQSGSESVTLTVGNMPSHNHPLAASTSDGDASSPTNNYNAVTIDPSTLNSMNTYKTAANTNMNPAAIGQAGGNQPHQNMQPYTCINYIIALEGIFPSRN